jgi:hypothetical protein
VRRQRAYVRDWHGRFAKVASRRSKRLHTPRKRIHRFGSAKAKSTTAIIQIGRGKDPPTWDQMSGYGVNAKVDGKKLWNMKKRGDFKDEDSYVKAMAVLARQYAKSHPGATAATKNQIGNAALRHEHDEMGKVTPLPIPNETPKGPSKKAAPAPEAEREVVDKTKGGVKIVKKKSKRTIQQVKADYEAARKKLSDLMDEAVAYKDKTGKNYPNYLDESHQYLEDMDKFEKEMKNYPPDLSRKISEATNFASLNEIMEARHPGLQIDDFEKIVARKRQEEIEYYTKTRQPPLDRSTLERSTFLADPESSFRAARQSFSGLDRMMTKYPKINITSLHCRYGYNIVGPGARQMEEGIGASCSRVYDQCWININPIQLVQPGNYMHKTKRGGDWHAPGHEKLPFASDSIHEFGHAFDWFANLYTPDKDGKNDSEANSKKREHAISKIVTDLFFEAHPKGTNSAKDITKWLRDDKQITGYSWVKGEDKLNDDELLAEAFTDVQLNGENATKVNKALFQMMEDNLRKQKML